MPRRSPLAPQRTRHAFENGDVLALLECVIACSEHDRPVPRWVRDALAKGFRTYLNTAVPLHVALFGARRGRHADPRNALRDALSKELKIGAITLAEARGYKGDRKYDHARKLLQSRTEVVSEHRLKQLTRGGRRSAMGAVLVGIGEAAQRVVEVLKKGY